MDSIIMTLNKVSRDSDCIGKFGPKHVLFVCIETNEQGAQLFAQRLTKEINKHNNKNNIGLDCRISL